MPLTARKMRGSCSTRWRTAPAVYHRLRPRCQHSCAIDIKLQFSLPTTCSVLCVNSWPHPLSASSSPSTAPTMTRKPKHKPLPIFLPCTAAVRLALDMFVEMPAQRQQAPKDFPGAEEASQTIKYGYGNYDDYLHTVCDCAGLDLERKSIYEEIHEGRVALLRSRMPVVKIEDEDLKP